jgi:hypothetical protein
VIEVASHIVGVMALAWFAGIGICAAFDLSRNGGVMPRTNREEN